MIKEIVFLTCHGKEAAVSSVLNPQGYVVQTFNAFDTDSLGTFTDEKERVLTQAQSALKKAQLACELTGKPYGLGSEGSFGPHPQAHLLPWNMEVLAFWDDPHQHAIYAVHGTAETNFAAENIKSLKEAIAFAQKVDFPSHGLIVGTSTDTFFSKGLTALTPFKTVLQSALKYSASVWLETDMRAHMNPSRMRSIAKTAEKLATLLGSHCPQCKLPGYGVSATIQGAPCQVCQAPTRLPMADQWTCHKCHFSETQPLVRPAPAACCDICNP